MTDGHDDQSDPVPDERGVIAAARRDAEAVARCRAIAAASADATAPPLAGRRIGGFLLTRVIAVGGMGTVWEALQESPRRVVALKTMRAGVASPSALRRFGYEAQFLARLRHPGIAQIYEAGVHEHDGERVPYFAMECIPDALPITAWVRRHTPGTRERLEMFAKVCDAVHHGHQNGVIHRDLKPSNILVDPAGQPKVIDFGVACSTDSDLAVTTLHTDAGQLIGTLRYMSPEQVGGGVADPHDLDTRSDVYALGVVLYELLTGRPPHDLDGRPIHEAARVIREQDPVRPSAIVRALRGDVETITLKALEKDRARRYDSAAALAEDVRRYLRREPIAARPPSVIYQARMLARRNRAVVYGALAVLLALLAGIGGTTWGLVRERARASELEEMVGFHAGMFGRTDPFLMGSRLREDVLADARGARVRAGMEEAEVEKLARLLEGVNFTNLGLRSVDRNVLEPALEEMNTKFASRPALWARLLQTAAYTYVRLGMHREAEPHLRRALEICRHTLGDNHRETLRSMARYGDTLHALGELDEASALLVDAVKRCRRVLGAHDPDTLLALTYLGGLRMDQDRPAEAEPYYDEALEGRRSVLGEDHPDTLTSMNNVGVSLLRQERLAEAERILTDALNRSQGVPRENSLGTLVLHANMGRLRLEQGRHDEAEDHFGRALEGFRRLGDDHPRTQTSLSNMGDLRRAQGRLDEAESLHRRAVEGLELQFGKDDWRVANARLGLGRDLTALGRFEEAERELLEFERVVGLPRFASPGRRRQCTEALAALYEAWHKAEP